MWYYVSKVEGDKVILSRPYEEKAVDVSELDSIDATIIGYNRITKKVAVKTLEDVLSYYNSKYKLMGKEPIYYIENSETPVICTNLQFDIDVSEEDGYADIATVTITDNGITEGVATKGVIDWCNIQSNLSVKCIFNVIFVFDLYGNTIELEGKVRDNPPVSILTVKGIEFKNKDYIRYKAIRRLFTMSYLMNVDDYCNMSEYLEKILFIGVYSDYSTPFTFVSLDSEQIKIDMTDIKFSPDVVLESMHYCCPIGLELPDGVNHVNPYESYMEFNNTTRIEEKVCAENFLTVEYANALSELISTDRQRLREVGTIWLVGCVFDVTVRELEDYLNSIEGNIVLLTMPKSHKITFTEKFCNSIYELIKNKPITYASPYETELEDVLSEVMIWDNGCSIGYDIPLPERDYVDDLMLTLHKVGIGFGSTILFPRTCATIVKEYIFYVFDYINCNNTELHLTLEEF